MFLCEKQYSPQVYSDYINLIFLLFHWPRPVILFLQDFQSSTFLRISHFHTNVYSIAVTLAAAQASAFKHSSGSRFSLFVYQAGYLRSSLDYLVVSCLGHLGRKCILRLPLYDHIWSCFFTAEITCRSFYLKNY